jgi:hypothetical protein
MDSVIKGNAGEFYVLAELSRRGWTAAQTARNARAFDILARQGSKQVAIRVKTKTHLSTGFQWNAKKDGTIFPGIGGNDYCVLVDIPEVAADNSASPVYYIVPTEKLDRWLKEDFDRWVNTPGPIKAQRSQDNTRRIIHVDDNTAKTGHGYRVKLEKYIGRWDILEDASNLSPATS